MKSEFRIVYERKNGQVSVLIPADKCSLTIEEVAKKDVPPGLRFKIVHKSEVPSDRSFRTAAIVTGKLVHFFFHILF